MKMGESARGVILLVGSIPGSADALGEAGFDVERAPGTGAALARVAGVRTGDERRFDCVVADHDPPTVDGLLLCERLGRRRPGIPVVLHPRDGSESLAAGALDAGVSAYVPGGSPTGRLVSAVERVVGRGEGPLSCREVFENVDAGLVVRDAGTGETVDANRRYCELLGRSREEAMAFDLTDLGADVPGYDTERGRELFRRAVEDPSFAFEWPVRRTDGGVVWVDVGATVTPIEGRDRLLVTVKDVSDRHERERVLETLHGAAERIGVCETVETACEATVSAASEALDFEMCAVLVAEGEWLVPRATSAGAPDSGVRRMRTDQGLAGRTLRSGESRLVGDVAEDPDADPASESYRSGISVPVGDVAVLQTVATEPNAFREADVELAELLVTHTAMALDRIRFEAELRRQNERLDEFASVVSHDLRNPLNVAQARLDIAREDDDGAHLAVVADALSRMNTIIDDALQLARQAGGTVELEPVDLSTFAGRCWELVETGDSTLETDGEPFALRADPDRLRNLFENLFRNSVEHSSTNSRAQPDDSVEHGSTGSRTQSGDSVEHGSTTPRSQARDDSPAYGSTSNRTKPDDAFEHGSGGSRTTDDESGDGDRSVTVRVGALGSEGFFVEDDGPGIPEGERERVFEPGRTTADEGTGFGLAIVARVAEAHGWEITATEAPSGGARFEVRGVEPAD